MTPFDLSSTLIIVSMIILYILGTGWLTMKLRSKTNDQFMVAGKSLSGIIVGILLMSEFIGAKSTLGTAESAFGQGIAASWATITVSIGFFLFGLFLVQKFYKSGDFTISGIIRKKYGNSTRIIVSVIMIYALILVNVGNYLSGAAALSTVLNVSLPVASFIIAIVSTFYYAYGGLKGVAYVTILHSIVKYIGVLIVTIVAFILAGGIKPMAAHLPAYYFTWDGKVGVGTIGAWIIGNVGAIFSTQFIIQAISAAKNPGEARKSSFYAAILCAPLGIFLGFIGVAAKYLYPNIKGLYAFPVFLHNMNPILAGIVTTSIVASIFVGVSTVALATTSLVMKDFYVPYFKPNAEQELKATRKISFIIGFLPLIFVFFTPQLLSLSFFTRALRASIAMVAVLGFYLPFFGSNRGATWGLVLSCVSTTVWYLLNNPFGVDNMYIAILTPLLVIVIERLFRGKQKIMESERWIEGIEKAD